MRKERGAEGPVRYFVAPATIDNRAGGTPADEGSATVATLVEIAVPPGVGAARLAAGFRAAVPEYQAIAGLLRKSFTYSVDPDGQPLAFGGIYLWRDETAARAWFNDAWHARVLQAYGRSARIEWFDTPILLPNATQEILLKVTTHLSSYRGEAAFSTWVFTIARRHLLDAATKSAEAPLLSLEAMAEKLGQGLDIYDTLTKASGEKVLTPEDHLQARQTALSCTQSMLMTLPRSERLAWILEVSFHLWSTPTHAATAKNKRQRLRCSARRRHPAPSRHPS